MLVLHFPEGGQSVDADALSLFQFQALSAGHRHAVVQLNWHFVKFINTMEMVTCLNYINCATYIFGSAVLVAKT